MLPCASDSVDCSGLSGCQITQLLPKFRVRVAYQAERPVVAKLRRGLVCRGQRHLCLRSSLRSLTLRREYQTTGGVPHETLDRKDHIRLPSGEHPKRVAIALFESVLCYKQRILDKTLGLQIGELRLAGQSGGVGLRCTPDVACGCASFGLSPECMGEEACVARIEVALEQLQSDLGMPFSQQRGLYRKGLHLVPGSPEVRVEVCLDLDIPLNVSEPVASAHQSRLSPIGRRPQRTMYTTWLRGMDSLQNVFAA